MDGEHLRSLLFVALPLVLVGSPAGAGSVDPVTEIRGAHSSKVAKKHKLHDELAVQEAKKAQKAGAQVRIQKRTPTRDESDVFRAWREADI